VRFSLQQADSMASCNSTLDAYGEHGIETTDMLRMQIFFKESRQCKEYIASIVMLLEIDVNYN